MIFFKKKNVFVENTLNNYANEDCKQGCSTYVDKMSETKFN